MEAVTFIFVMFQEVGARFKSSFLSFSYMKINFRIRYYNLSVFPNIMGDTASGVGASHQTGWSSLVAALLRNISPD